MGVDGDVGVYVRKSAMSVWTDILGVGFKIDRIGLCVWRHAQTVGWEQNL